jgi:hypothetical protein
LVIFGEGGGEPIYRIRTNKGTFITIISELGVITMETKIKILTALSIPYAFLCAGLYQIAFWTPFNINGFSFLDISDIIKSFVLPFLYSSSAALFMHLFHFNTTIDIWPYGGGNSQPANRKKRLIFGIIQIIYISVLGYFLTIHEDKWKGLYVPLMFLPGLYFALSEFVIRKNIIIHEKSRFFLLYLIVLLPISSYTSGTKNACNIYENKKYEYNDTIIPKQDLKFLGKTSEHYIFISLDNKTKYFYSTELIQELKLKEFKSE